MARERVVVYPPVTTIVPCSLMINGELAGESVVAAVVTAFAGGLPDVVLGSGTCSGLRSGAGVGEVLGEGCDTVCACCQAAQCAAGRCQRGRRGQDARDGAESSCDAGCNWSRRECQSRSSSGLAGSETACRGRSREFWARSVTSTGSCQHGWAQTSLPARSRTRRSTMRRGAC